MHITRKYYHFYYFFSTFAASKCLFAKVSATINGKTKVASANILTYFASSLSFAQVYPSDAFAPESLPSQYSPVLIQTAQSSPFLQILAFSIWCLATPPPKIIAPVLGDFIAILEISFVSQIISITSSFLNEFVKRTSPMAPSVKAGQKTGILFLQHQQQMLSSLFISLPNREITFLGVHLIFSFTCSLYRVANSGSRYDSSLTQLSLGTRMFPILQCPLSLFWISFILYSAIWKVPRHFIKSSSIPPAVVTTQSTILCWTRQRIISLIPQEAMLDVQPKKIVHLFLARYEGSLVYQSSLQFKGSSDNLQLIISLTMLIALLR